MSTRRSHLLLVALILVALVGAALLIVPGSPVHREPVLGLDLQGGFEVVYEAVPPEGRPLRDSDLDRSVDVIRNRVDKLGVAEPEVRKQGEDQIAVALPGVDNPNRVREVIGSTARLELYDLQPALTGPSIDAQGFPVAQASLYDLLASSQTQSLVRKNERGAGPYYLFERESQERIAGPLPSEAAIQATDRGKTAYADGKLKDAYRVFAVPANTTVITCGGRADFCPGAGNVGLRQFFYLFKHTPEAAELEDRFPQMTGEDLRLSGTRQDFDTTTGLPIVLMRFTDKGEEKFHDITRQEAIRGQLLYNRSGGAGDPDDFNQSFAIVLDDEIVTFPTIDFNEYPSGIRGENGAQITGIGSVQEAQDIALVLQTGALPVEFQTLSETQISATLGEDSLREALRAALVGLAVVAVFLLLFYRFLGLVAVLGLGIYAVFLYAMILLFNVTLTLPGFAGMILTIGVAADANIVIFERIKEEARGGRSVRAAVAAGYGKGFSTIVDANVVTAITALVLFTLATAGVRGFALMLLIGTAMSLVTAVFATRAMLGLLAGFRWFDSPKFMGAEGVQIPKWIQHDYVGKRRVWFAFSSVVLVVSVLALGIRGLNLGIDFEGGTKVSFSTAQPQLIEDVRAQADRVGEANAVIQGVGEPVGDRYREFQLQAEALSSGEQTRLEQALRSQVGGEDFNVTTVSASFGEQIAESAIYAILISLLLVVVYISIRFQWKFAFATIIALLHDVLIAVGIYAVIGKEVTTATVAAILTVLGYSIYDTIIILDRVRENMPLMRRATFPTIANTSLWETIRRSLATTFITLLPISALYLFGGETLKDFALALLVGIGSGAYSSIFIAAPLVSWLKEKEPEYSRRHSIETAKEAPGEEGAAPARPRAPKPGPAPALATAGPPSVPADKRERRRQRRRSRPHGRAR